MSNRVAQLVTNASPKLADLVQRAARQTDSKISEYLRSALVQKLRADGFDVAAALQGED